MRQPVLPNESASKNTHSTHDEQDIVGADNQMIEIKDKISQDVLKNVKKAQQKQKESCDVRHKVENKLLLVGDKVLSKTSAERQQIMEESRKRSRKTVKKVVKRFQKNRNKRKNREMLLMAKPGFERVESGVELLEGDEWLLIAYTLWLPGFSLFLFDFSKW
ncbi:unnamed protein product [Mytilus edulis]|uniref:Uncharacterized protein n=1 Tax=Mytilus edulis TaxID=6550 RepID=A0A8S3S8V2_MYTED|nr:unnamed protein product [Mytilus edulis]